MPPSSDGGKKIANPRFYRRDEADLKRVQQRKDAAKNAQNWPENAKQKSILAKIHEQIANRRNDFAQKESRKLVNAYQVIVFEDVAPMEMGRSRGMRKSILDVAWTQFMQMTIAKAEEAGRRVILVNPKNTTKMCSSCTRIVPKELHERVHTCPHCGLEQLKTRHGRWRTLVVDLADDTAAPLVEMAELVRQEGPRAWLRFDRERTSAAALIAAVAERYPVRDLTVEEPEIEAIVRGIYENGVGAA
ncbi:IS200/IS605 family element transposase accessory protein TnpB [Chloroflexales bacterium ZM16-3]|nr:IS200/IS605 family element transposase accessory protein TnpB [Chloroflexales bacterium ZM16-3]